MVCLLFLRVVSSVLECGTFSVLACGTYGGFFCSCVWYDFLAGGVISLYGICSRWEQGADISALPRYPRGIYLYVNRNKAYIDRVHDLILP